MPVDEVQFQEERAILEAGGLQDWTVDRLAETAVGTCPTCLHTTTFRLRNTAVAQGQQAPELGAPQLVTCRCGNTHDDRAQTGHQSCGRWWLMRVQPEGETPQVVPVLDDSRLPIAQALAAEPDHEKTVRAAAEKWVAGVTALLGLLGLSGVVVNKDALEGVGDDARSWFGVLVVVAVAAAALAVFNSYRAAYGWPDEVDVSTERGQLEWWRQRLTVTRSVLADLRWGVRYAVTAVVALILAVGVLWFGGPGPKPRLTVESSDDSVVCGELLEKPAGGALRIRTADGTVMSIATTDVTKLTVVDAC